MVKVISTIQDDVLVKRPAQMELQEIGPAKYIYTFSYRKSAEKAADKLRALGADVGVFESEQEAQAEVQVVQ